MANRTIQAARAGQGISMALGGVVLAAVLAAPGWASPASNGAGSTRSGTTTSATGCSGLVYGGQQYCNAMISAVRATSYGVGMRVVLRDVSVTAIDKSGKSVTVAALEWPTCPTGSFCGATARVESLTVAWIGSARPERGRVINLFGTTVAGPLKPVGYVTTTACYIDCW